MALDIGLCRIRQQSSRKSRPPARVLSLRVAVVSIVFIIVFVFVVVIPLLIFFFIVVIIIGFISNEDIDIRHGAIKGIEGRVLWEKSHELWYAKWKKGFTTKNTKGTKVDEE